MTFKARGWVFFWLGLFSNLVVCAAWPLTVHRAGWAAWLPVVFLSGPGLVGEVVCYALAVVSMRKHFVERRVLRFGEWAR